MLGLARSKLRLRTTSVDGDACRSPSSPSSGARPRATSAHVADPEDALRASCQKVSARIQRRALRVGVDAKSENDFGIFDTVATADREEVIRHARKDPRAKRAMGAMVGMAVADSVGHEFEFLPVGEKGHHFCRRSLKITGAHNRFKLKPGQWTDDTSMGLCLADSLLVRSRYDGSDMRVRFWNWWNKGYNNAFRRENGRVQSVGLGGNISMSLKDIEDDSPTPRFNSLGEDAGNGSLMRLAPVPIYFHQDIKLAMQMSAESSYTTHPGPIAADACSFMGFVIIRAIMREPSRASAATFLDECVKSFVANLDEEISPTLDKLFKAKEPPESSERCWNWRDRKGPYLVETIANRGIHYNGYPVSAGYFGSYSMDGLALSLHCMYHTSSFMEAIEKCINFLGDADSTGAICGQMAGAFYGVDAVDQRLVKRLEQWDGGEIALRGALLYGLGTDLGTQALERATSPSVEHPPLTRMMTPGQDYARTESADALAEAEPPKTSPEPVATPAPPIVVIDEALDDAAGAQPAHDVWPKTPEAAKATSKNGAKTGKKECVVVVEPEETEKTIGDESGDIAGGPPCQEHSSWPESEADDRLLKKASPESVAEDGLAKRQLTWSEMDSERNPSLVPKDDSFEEPPLRDDSCGEPPLRDDSCKEPAPRIDSEASGDALLSMLSPTSSKLRADHEGGVPSEAGSEGSDYSMPASPGAAPQVFNPCCGAARSPQQGSTPGSPIRPPRSGKKHHVFPDGVHSL